MEKQGIHPFPSYRLITHHLVCAVYSVNHKRTVPFCSVTIASREIKCGSPRRFWKVPLNQLYYCKMPNPPPEPSVAFVLKQADEATAEIGKTFKTTLERGIKLDDLKISVDVLAHDAAEFAKTSKKVKTKMWWEKTKVKFGIIALILLILLLIIIPLSIPSSQEQ